MPISQRDDYHLLSQKQQDVLVRLRTGHNRLNSHVHSKLKLASSPTCPCDQEDQTTEHVLQRCPLHKATREDVWPVNTSLMTKLYGCKQELEKTTSFSSVQFKILYYLFREIYPWCHSITPNSTFDKTTIKKHTY